MLTEDYLLVSASQLDELMHTTSSSAALDARKERLAKLGFKSLQHAETSVAPKLDMASMLWPELVGADLTLWKKFLPTQRSIRDFKYDSIPDESLDAIELAQQASVFDEIVIWTPEGNKLMGRAARAMDSVKDKIEVLVRSNDPMAVGIITDTTGQQHLFSIVRWGEALWSKQKIARYVSRVNWQARILSRVLPAILVIAAVAFYAAGIMAFGIIPMILCTFLAIVVLVVVVGVISMLRGWW